MWFANFSRDPAMFQIGLQGEVPIKASSCQAGAKYRYRKLDDHAPEWGVWPQQVSLASAFRTHQG